MNIKIISEDDYGGEFLTSLGSKGELSPLPQGRGYSEPFGIILSLCMG